MYQDKNVGIKRPRLSGHFECSDLEWLGLNQTTTVGARKPNMFGFLMVQCNQFFNGVRFSNDRPFLPLA